MFLTLKPYALKICFVLIKKKTYISNIEVMINAVQSGRSGLGFIIMDIPKSVALFVYEYVS